MQLQVELQEEFCKASESLLSLALSRGDGTLSPVDRLEHVLLFMKSKGIDGLGETLPPFLTEYIVQLLSHDELTAYFNHIIDQYDKSSVKSICAAKLLFTAYRQWAHLTQEPLLARQQYVSSVANELCAVIVNRIDSTVNSNMNAATESEVRGGYSVACCGHIVGSMSRESRKYIYKAICSSGRNSRAAVVLQDEAVLELLSEYTSSLSRSIRSGRIHLDQFQSWGEAEQEEMKVLSVLIGACTDKWDTATVIKEIARHPLDKVCSEVVIRSFPQDRGSVVLRCIAHQWGEVHFIRSGQISRHKYLTHMLLYSLCSATSESLSEEGDRGSNTSALSLLSQGVAACLDSADSGFRIRAMKVAKVFSRIMGVNIDYNEEEEEEEVKDTSGLLPEKNKIFKTGRGGDVIAASAPAALSSNNSNNNSSNSGNNHDPSNSGIRSSKHSEESDSQSDLESLLGSSDNEDMQADEGRLEYAAGASKHLTNYLRSCLQRKCVCLKRLIHTYLNYMGL